MEWWHIRIKGTSHSQNSRWWVWSTPLFWCTDFSHKDPRNAVIIDWIHSIWFLNVSKILKTKLYNLWYKSLQDLQRRYPKEIWKEHILDIYWKLKLFENWKYTPKWWLPIEVLRGSFSESTIQIISWWWRLNTLRQITKNSKFEERVEQLRGDSREKLIELLLSLRLIKSDK